MTGLLIGDLLDRGVAARPLAPAATLGAEEVGFAELDRRAAATTDRLRARGVRPGDAVVWLSSASLRALDVFLGCARAGAVFVPLNPAYTAPEVAAVLALVEPALVVADREHLDLVRSAGASDALDVAALDATGVDGGLPPLVAPQDTSAHIAYLTSGSTGTPKAVLVSHRASWLRATPGGGTFAAGLRGDGVACTFPLYHYGGWHYVMEAWQNMTPVHLVARADAEHVVATVERRRPVALYCIPAIWERVLDPAFARADLSSVRHADTGTSPVAGDLVERIKRRLPGSTTTILYGSTEVGRMAALQDHDLGRKAGSVGTPAFPCLLWTDAAGELWARSPAMMNGYLGGAADALVDGAYRTGDVGRIDAEGYVHLEGRSRELIRTAGEYVAPSEVEAALRDAPGVADVAVVGVPDPQWGEVVCAVVVPLPGAAVELATLRAHVRDRLASHKHPRRLVEVAAIPRTAATGQVQRSRLRTELMGQPAGT